MPKRILLFVVALLALLLLAMPVLATQPDYATGTWDNYWFDDQNEYYEVHGPFEGQVTQPIKPGRAQKAIFEGYVGNLEGECQINVVTIGAKGTGRGTILQCSGDLQGLQATMTISLDDFENFTGSYEVWMHFEP